MKKLTFICFCLSCFSAFAQTAGTLTFTFTQVAQSPCYSGSKNVLAVWIQDNAGGFIKTKLRNVGSSTKDHLPTWAVNSGGTANNATSANCNITDATTGATLTSFGTKTITWDGKNVNGASNGSIVADGTYKVTIQETWNHPASATALKSFTFTKGPNPDHQTPADDSHFSGVVIDWLPSPAGLEDNNNEIEELNIMPNPSTNGIFNVSFEHCTNVMVYDILGHLLIHENLEMSAKNTTIDLSAYHTGIYFIRAGDGKKSSYRKVLYTK